MMPYQNSKNKKFQQMPYTPFLDYKTGKAYDESTNTQFYWTPLSEVIGRYIEHLESKLDGDTGFLQRKHVLIDKKSIVHIGKESNELEESMVLGVNENNYTIYDDIRNIISNMSVEDARSIGISRSNYYYLKKKASSGRLSLKQSTINKLMRITHR